MSEITEIDATDSGYKQVQLGPKKFKIPKRWSVKEITDVCDLNPYSFSPDEYEGKKFEYIDIDSVSPGQIDQSKTISINEAPSRAKRRVKTGNTLVAKVRPYLRAFAPVTEEYDNCVCSTGFAVLESSGQIDPEYLTQTVLSKYFLDQMTNRMTGTSYPSVSKSDFQNIQILAPPLPEQRRIATVLSSVDEKIHQTEGVIESTGELKHGLTHDLFSKGTRRGDLRETRIGPRSVQIPMDWDLMSVEELASDSTDKKVIRGGPPGGKIKKEERAPGGAKLYVQENVIYDDFEMGDDYLSQEMYEDLKSAKVDPGDVLVTRSGTIGRSQVFPESAQRGILGSSLIRIKVDRNLVRSGYLSQYIDESPMAKAQIKSMSHGGTRTGLNNKIVKSIQVPVPDIEEQDKIIGYLAEADDKLQQEREHREKLQELKRGLMQDLLTGTIRTPPDLLD